MAISDDPFDFKALGFSDSEGSSVVLFWRKLREKDKLTGPHLSWHQHELARIASGWPYGYPAESEADATGVTESVRAARGIFDKLFELCRQRWLDSDARFETLVGWLGLIQQQVVTAVELIWAGDSDTVVRWYRRACEPAVKKALVAKARAIELEAAPTREEMLLRDIKEQLGRSHASAAAVSTKASAPGRKRKPAGRGASKPVAQRGYKPEINQWMKGKNFRTQAQAIHWLGISMSVFTGIRSGKLRCSADTLAVLLEKMKINP